MSKARDNGAVEQFIAGSDELPEGWVVSTIGEAYEVNPRKVPADALPPNAPVTFVPMPAVDADCGAITAPETREFGAVRKGYTSFIEDDVIVAKITPCMENGKAAIAHSLENCHGFGSSEFHVLRSTGAALPEYVYHFVRQESFRREAESRMTGSVGQKRVPPTFLSQHEFPLPPLAEQKRIVAKVEALLERVNKARERLDRVPGILKKFRQSVLAAACSGRLTADWREKNPQSDGAHSRHQRLLHTRKVNWQGSRRYSDPLPIAEADLPDLPDEWCYASASELLREPLANGRSVVDQVGGFPVLRLTALKQGRIDLSESKEGKWTAEEAAKYVVVKDDFLVSRGNGSLSLVGRGGLVEDEPHPVAYPDTLIRVRLGEDILVRYFRLAWASEVVRRQIETAAHTTAGIHKVSQQDIGGFAVPCPPISEQKEIIERVESLLELAKHIEQHLAAGTRHTERIIQSVLARAFAGEIVETEADLARREGRDYEPAPVLLERIAVEGSAASNGRANAARQAKAKTSSRKRKRLT